VLHSLHIEVLNTSALHPASKGRAENCVKITKNLMKKFLNSASHDTLNWHMLPYVVSKCINLSPSSKSGFTPMELVFGNNYSGAWSNKDPLENKHSLMFNEKVRLQTLTTKINEMVTKTKLEVERIRSQQNAARNANRVSKQYQVGQIIFVKDSTYIPGNPRPLKLKYNISPYVIEKNLYTTVVCRRLSDNMMVLYSKDRIKEYLPNDHYFKDLPNQIKQSLLVKFADMDLTDFLNLAQHDPLLIPTAIQLPMLDDDNDEDNHNVNTSFDLDDPIVTQLDPTPHRSDTINQSTKEVIDSTNDPLLEDLPTLPLTATDNLQFENDDEIDDDNVKMPKRVHFADE